SYITGSLDRKPWEHPEVIKVINNQSEEMLNFRWLLVGFLTGSVGCWVQFTSEFAPRGLIDMATEEEEGGAKDWHDLWAWMPATNGANEGALWSYWVMLHFKPNLTFAQYNTITIYVRNNTQQFMNAMFTEEDYQVCAIDSSEEEARRQKEQLEFNDKLAQMQQEKVRAVEEKQVEKLRFLSTMVLIDSVDQISKLMVVRLNEQLDLLHLMDTEIPKKSICGRKEEQCCHLKDAFLCYVDHGKPSFDAFFITARPETPVLADWAGEDEEDN
ncbi:hypothetical protein K435DRAFT_676988, partial [Dendrothele bispora CBS 962.96]